MPRPLLPGLVAALGLLAACTDASRLSTAPDIAKVVEVSADRATMQRVTAAARWNLRTRAIIGRQKVSSNAAARVFALVSVAQYNAVIAAEEARGRAAHPSEAGAASAASATVLAALYPLEQTFIEKQLAEDAEDFSRRLSERDAAFAAGAAVGRAVAAVVLAYAATDGSGAPWDGVLPSGPGYWTPVSLPPQDASWGRVRPWLMTSGDQFHSPPPPPYGSPAFLTDLAGVRYLSDNRTRGQEEIARYWASGYGAGGPAGFFGSVAVGLANREHLDERRTARALAVMHMAIMDASIGCYEAKYDYWYIRPYQADPAITTPVGTPNFPSYPSAHSCLSSAAAEVLAALFPAEARDLRAMVEEAGISRVYAGLHFRFDIAAGQELGIAAARLALRLAPERHQPIALD